MQDCLFLYIPSLLVNFPGMNSAQEYLTQGKKKTRGQDMTLPFLPPLLA
jgi:hypothetical protein